MRNLIIAITSFFATVLIFSQVALAQNSLQDVPWENRTNPQGAPNLPYEKAPADESGKNMQSGVANAGNDCPDGTCFKNTVAGDLERGHSPKCTEGNKASCTGKAAASSSGSGGNKSNGGSQ